MKRFRSFIVSMFGAAKRFVTSGWKELGQYTSYFTKFGTDIYADEVCRASIRTLAEHTSKANVKVFRNDPGGRVSADRRLERLIQQRPNIYMNGKDFLYKIRTMLEINNIVFIYIQRDEIGRCAGLYPMPAATYEALDVGGDLYIRFIFPTGAETILSWEDLAVLRKDYNTSDIFSDTNDAILTSLDLLTTTNEGMANAIKATANLRGILKSTKAMMSSDDVTAMKEKFVEDFLTLENTSGIASLDSTQEFIPLNIAPQLADYRNVRDLRDNIYRYFGVNEDVVMSKATADMWQAFYEARLEPFLLALSLELTNKVFTPTQRDKGYEIIFEANRMSFLSMGDKLALVAMVDRGALTPNEWRSVMNLAPIDGGDAPIRRLDTAPINQVAESQQEEWNDDK